MAQGWFGNRITYQIGFGLEEILVGVNVDGFLGIPQGIVVRH